MESHQQAIQQPPPLPGDLRRRTELQLPQQHRRGVHCPQPPHLLPELHPGAPHVPRPTGGRAAGPHLRPHLPHPFPGHPGGVEEQGRQDAVLSAAGLQAARGIANVLENQTWLEPLTQPDLAPREPAPGLRLLAELQRWRGWKARVLHPYLCSTRFRLGLEPLLCSHHFQEPAGAPSRRPDCQAQHFGDTWRTSPERPPLSPWSILHLWLNAQGLYPLK